MMRPIQIFLIIAAASVVCMTGCGGTMQDPEAFVVGLEGNPTNLDPRYGSDAYSSRIRPLIFDSLVNLDLDGTFIPGLAKSWTISDDGLVYTFNLKQGVVFHDGRPLTSRDVKYTFEFLKNPKNKCPAAGDMEKIISIETPDDLTVVFKLDRIFSPIMFKLIKGIVPAHLGDKKNFGDHPVGSGSYKLIEFDRGERFIFEANENYHAGPPSIKKLRFEVVRNDTTRLLRLRKGELHLVQNAVPPYAVKFLQREKHLKLIRKPGINYSYIGFNLKDQRGITSEPNVRKAIAHAIDRKMIIDALLKGYARPATGLIAPHVWVYNPNVPVYEHDIEKAKALLDQAGFVDPDGDGPQKRFVLSFKTSTNKLRNRIAEVLAVQLAEVGIGLDKRSYEWGTFFDDVKKGNFQTYTLSWVGITDPDIFHYIFHSTNQPPAGANRGRYENPEIDRLIDQTRLTTDTEKRKELFQKIQHTLAEDCVYVSLWWVDNIVVADKGLEGFIIYPGGEYSSLSKAVWERAK